MSVKSKALAALRLSIVSVRRVSTASVQLAKDAKSTAQQAWNEDLKQ